MQDVYTVSQGWSDFTLKAKLRRQQAGPQGQTQDAILQSCFMWETEGIQIIFWDISKVMCQQVMWLFKPQKVGIPTPWFHLSLRPLRAVNWNKASWLAAPCPEVVLGGSPPADTAAHDGVPQKALSLVSLLGTSGQEVVTQHGNSLLQVTEWPMPFLGSWKICLLCSGSNYWFIDSGGIPPEQKQYWEHVQCKLPAASCDRSHVCCKAKVDDFHSFATWPSTTWRATCVVWKKWIYTIRQNHMDMGKNKHKI